jgi:spermidine/putrescine transport system ATP-binding protein
MVALDPVVRFEGVSKSFGRTQAVKELDLAISAGQFVTLLGPSGCGKSTSLRMLGGFEMPSAGRILLGDRDVTRLPPHRREVNMVFQDYALFPHMTVAENVAFGLELKGMARPAIMRRVQDLLGLVQLEGMGERTPDQLSGGQRQRVALIRALAPDPKVLLLDEPLGALDAKLRSQMQIELKAIQERTGKTFLFVTHDQEEALTMSDRVIVMNEGRIEQDGPPEELYQRPASRFVATFIGETNLLDCTVRGRDGVDLILDWGRVPLRARANAVCPAAGARIEVALRPESLVCSPVEPTTPNRVRATVGQRVFKGSRTMLVLEVEGAGALQASLDPWALEGLGQAPVWVGWEADRMAMLRDGAEGRR